MSRKKLYNLRTLTMSRKPLVMGEYETIAIARWREVVKADNA